MMLTPTEYATRSYGKKSSVEQLSDWDFKLIESINKMRISNKEALTKRKCIVFLEDPPEQIIVKPRNVDEKKTILLCSATKMDGQTCGAKAKPGKCFCGRHAKLEKS